MPTQINLKKQERFNHKILAAATQQESRRRNSNRTRHIYTVSELTQNIKQILENSFPAIWLEGEISNFTHHLSGHIYFSLKDENAIISACLFKNVNQRIKFKLEDGLKVICFGRITVYGKRGQYQIVIERIEPKGIGALQLAFEQLKEKLFKQGLFDSVHKRPIPIIPFSVGIVTSASGAAIRDILKILTTEAGFLRIVLRPTVVQGEEAKYDIAQAIAEFNQYSPRVDLLIVGRGGGSIEDLWAFNEEVVARAIFDSDIPIISAVGHEIDHTIADLVADLSAPTPSAAAKIIVHKKNEILKNLGERCLLLTSAIREKIYHLEEGLNLIYASPAFRHPLQRIEEFQQDLDSLTHSVFLAIQHLVQIADQKLAAVSGKFQALNPISILARGFSLTTTIGGKIIKQANCLKQGELVNTRLAQGSFQSEIKKIEDK